MKKPVIDWKHFQVQVLVAHPSFTPQQITAGLGMKAKFQHCVGKPRKTPSGRVLGIARDTRWRYVRRYRTKTQYFAGNVADLVDRLEPRRAFLGRLVRTGGRIDLNIWFFGTAYFGDALPPELLRRMADLGLALGVETFPLVRESLEKSRSQKP